MTTIAAIATSHGSGGVSIIKISGKNAFDVAAKCFFPYRTSLKEAQGGQALVGKVVRDGVTIDEAVAVVWHAPRSYTGEDTVEFNCHGGVALTREVLALVLESGAILAQPGEFTRRAYLNGKITLSQAESVIDLVNAENLAQIKVAAGGTVGRLSRKIDAIRGSLTAALAQSYVFTDYADEDLVDLTPEQLVDTFDKNRQELNLLLRSYKNAQPILTGVNTVIVGKPNTGKSSLLNMILGHDRAIVSPYAGTTRDTIEERVALGEVTLRITDTAGIRNSSNPIEQEGIRRSMDKLNSAELILCVLDSSAPLDDEDNELLDLVSESSARKIALLNKADLPLMIDISASGNTFDKVRHISAATGEGLDGLQSAIEELFIKGAIDYSTDAILTSVRAESSALRARDSLAEAITALQNNSPVDLACLHAEEALSALDDLDGRGVSGQIIDSIFSTFCVGK